MTTPKIDASTVAKVLADLRSSTRVTEQGGCEPPTILRDVLVRATDLIEALAPKPKAKRAPKPLPTPEAGGPHGDVHFLAVSKYGNGTPEAYELGWEHCGRSQFTSDTEWSAFGWSLYVDGDLHDGFRSLREVMDDLGPTVWLSLPDFKRNRGIQIEGVIDAARAWVKLPCLAETPANEVDGEMPETEET